MRVVLTSLTVDASHVQLVDNIKTLWLFGAAASSDLFLLTFVALITLFPPFAPLAFL